MAIDLDKSTATTPCLAMLDKIETCVGRIAYAMACHLAAERTGEPNATDQDAVIAGRMIHKALERSWFGSDIEDAMKPELALMAEEFEA